MGYPDLDSAQCGGAGIAGNQSQPITAAALTPASSNISAARNAAHHLRGECGCFDWDDRGFIFLLLEV